MRLLYDGNSYLNASLLRGVDHEFGKTLEIEGKKVQVNSAQYGVDGFWEKVAKDLEHFDVAPRQCVLVWDGMNAKGRRRSYLPTYKEGREKVPEVNVELNIARDRVTQMARDLGMQIAVQNKMEADDVLGYLSKHLRTTRNTIISRDGDLAVLVDENTDVWNGVDLNKNPFGGFPHRHITIYKALVGDPSDKIPGAKGFGDVAFVNLVREIGLDGLDEIEAMIVAGDLKPLQQYVKDYPVLQKVIDAEEMVLISWKCASLHIEDVNTLRGPLNITAGMVKQWDSLDDAGKVHELRKHYGTTTLVTAANYASAYERVAKVVRESPFVALDIETSSTDESDEWIERVNSISEKGKGNKIDVLGHELTGMSLTFGANTQHTIYMSVDHKDTPNITVDQCRGMVELIPQSLHVVIQNRQFEFSVLYRTWGDKWLSNGWFGFVPNALDTKVGASYVDENMPVGLKERSLAHLGYKQGTYEETTTIDGRRYKMNQLTGQHVLSYGADDTICTAALHSYYQLVMEVEGTWQVYLDVETLPEYLTSLAFVQGIPVSLSNLSKMEKADDLRYDESWKILRDFLMEKGWEGTSCPEFEGDIAPADVKLAASILLDAEFATRKRKLSGIAQDLREQFPESGELLASIVEANDVASLNKLVRSRFDGEPKINFNSPKQMQNLFYGVIGITPRILNKMTEKQRDDDVMRCAFRKFRKAKEGAKVEYTKEESEALMSKASTDDDAVASAMAMDNLDQKQRAVLMAYQEVRSISTRRSLFYKPYKVLPHWRDGRIHPSLNQASTVTRRHSSSAPNVQQMEKGAGGIREVILPHMEGAVVVSLDLSGQELRLAAEVSGDAAMTSCYVGENKRDMHHLTAVSAAPLIWGETITYEQLVEMLKSDDEIEAKRAKKLRADAKVVNFATAYGAMAPKIALTLMTNEETAQAFIDAKERAFPGLPKWSVDVQAEANRLGYSVTLLGARRHLSKGLQEDNKWDRMKAERQAGNFVIQGSGGEMIRLAMAAMWRKGLFAGKYRAQFFMPVHDEVVVSVHRDDLIPLLKEMHPCMVQQYASMEIPLESSISIGPTFGTQIELGTTIDEGKIESALTEIFGGSHASAS